MTGSATVPARALQQRRMPQVRPTVAFGCADAVARATPGAICVAREWEKVPCSGACHAPGRHPDFRVGRVPFERFLQLFGGLFDRFV
jgi:hypothetical protein